MGVGFPREGVSLEFENPRVWGNLPKSPVHKAIHFADFKPEYLFQPEEYDQNECRRWKGVDYIFRTVVFIYISLVWLKRYSRLKPAK